MGLDMVSRVRRYQGQCRALRPLWHQGYGLRSYNKDPPLHRGYTGEDVGGGRCGQGGTRIREASERGSGGGAGHAGGRKGQKGHASEMGTEAEVERSHHSRMSS